ncbi:autotransporter-associated N-terminal domain-containing protein [Leptotrichia sp. OH3620_COT-345]|uniref:autotransporter-associated N-terminal domain-containing protein n=1 Tax=Leptotrichia sp. OH3620_COT-345 TaxID=2491048 RepID=UPI000F64952A|nr:autotransporter-associated N-terminal domain-containing protein [Leptotrichia sp. OH3620_COT-345]RRD38863.1 autotransporter-associated N-terminal domain-containing protein [Leptotrichia sp. OH3620_COT-345]
MNNNLKNIEKSLRAFAKRTKDVRYTKGLLFSFLLMGMFSFSNILTSPEVKNTENEIKLTRKELNTSIKDLHIAFKQAKRENNRLLKNANLELIQLMEQGEQVIKSPWKSWQFGAGYYYNEWRGTYKGKGDKKEKYPFEGVLERDTNEINRYVPLDSENYNLLGTGTNLRSSSTNYRRGLTSGYGLASVKLVTEPPISIKVNAGITPRFVSKNSPVTVPSAPAIILPAFEPKLVAPPKAPDLPPKPAIELFDPVNITFNGAGFGQPGGASLPRTNIIAQNWSTYSTTADLNIQINNNNTSWTGGELNVSYSGGNSVLSPGASGVALNAFINHVDDRDVDVQGVYNVVSSKSNFPLFISLNPYEYGAVSAPDKTFTLSGTLNMSTTGGGTIVGIEHQLLAGHGGGTSAVPNVNNGITTSILRNTGSINMNSGENMIGIMIDTEYFQNDINSYFKKKPETINDGSISIGRNASLSIGVDYGYFHYHSNSADVNLKGPNTNVKLGNITIDGTKSYGYRQKDYTTTSAFGHGNSPAYYDAMGTVSGENGVITLNGSQNVGLAIAQGRSTGDPISNLEKIQVLVNGESNIGFLRSSDTATVNTDAITLDSVKIGDTFNFGGDASKGVLIRSDKNEIIVDKDFTLTSAKKNNTFMQAGKTGTVTFNTGKTMTSTMDEFYGLTAGNFLSVGATSGATAENKGTLIINGNKSIGIAIDKNNTGKSSGTINYKGSQGAAIYNLGTFTLEGALSLDGKSNTGIYNNEGTLSINGGADTTINAKNGSTGIYSNGGTVKIDPVLGAGKAMKITIDDTASTDKGTGVYIEGGATANLNGAEIEVKKGASGVVSTGQNGLGTGSILNLENAKLKYDGSGYAVFTSGGGSVNIKGAEIELRGDGVGFEQGTAGSLVTDSNTKAHIYSNDVTVFNLRDVTGGLSATNLFNNVKGKVANMQIIDTYGFTDYRLAAINGLDDYRIDKNIDKSIAADPTQNRTDDYVFTKYLAVQKAKVNLISGNKVTAHLNGTQLNSIGIFTPVGIDMNSSATATNKNQTGITLQNNTEVSVDRTDAGSGAVGLFINYGQVDINNGAVVNVERSGINAANDGAVGVYAVNDSDVVNGGTINVGGKNSIGILGLSYRSDTLGLKINEFNQTTGTDGNINATNNNLINLDGESAVGIYVENNDSRGNIHNIAAQNTGTITMSGQKAVGMAGKKFTSLTNSGIIKLEADLSAGMFGSEMGTLINTGKIDIGDSSNESVLRIGMFTKDQNVKIVNNGIIEAGKNSYGIYGKDVETGGASVFNVGENGVGIFSVAEQNLPVATDNIKINAGTTFNIGDNNAVGVFTENSSNGIQITDNGSKMNIGNNSYGYVFKGRNTKFTNVIGSNVSLKEKSVYLYSNDSTASIINNAKLVSTAGETYGLYSAGTVVNNADMDFVTGIGNVGMYSINGGTATNNATISVGSSNPGTSKFGIGMAAGYKNLDYAKVVNGPTGVINVNGISSIGMYATGSTGSNKSIAENHGKIYLSAEGTIGMYLDEGAEGHNYGEIRTTGTVNGAVGIVLSNNSKFVNHAGAKVHIDSPGGFGIYRVNSPLSNVTIVNYGDITVGSGAKEDGEYDPTGGKPLDKSAGGVRIFAPAGSTTAEITLNGILVPNIDSVNKTYGTIEKPLISKIGMYVDTLRGTNPINGLSALGVEKAELLIGPEAAEKVNGKYIEVGENILNPYRAVMKGRRGIEWSINSASLTWMALPIIDGNGTPQKIYMAKIPYTEYAGNQATPVEKTDTYNFLDGLEKRYGIEGIDTREKAVFNKLNKIGNNEEVLFYQAIDQMMGHQYANIQQRLNSTSVLLNKEFDNIRKMQENTSKKSNRITTFGVKGKYNTDTAGVINYTNNAYGVAYVSENETIKLGNSTGWYAGVINNRFKFKDIGKSKESTTMLKLGVFSSKAFDNNGSLNWTVSGEGFAGRSEMERRYLIVDEIFKAKSTYNTYGLALKNEISKEFRTGEKFSIKPYGNLKLEYGKFGAVKEKNGEIRLEVKGNDYFSIKPEVGTEFKYRQIIGERATFTAALGLGYENELGQVANVKNKAKVAYTDAGYFNIRSEKDNRKGNFKADLNVGIDNQKFGITFNAGYDTKGKNVRGGIGFRAIY